MKRALFFLLPLVAFLALASGFGIVIMNLGVDRGQVAFAVIPGLILFVFLIWLIRRLARWAGITLYPLSGRSKLSPLYGFLIGATTSILCGLSFARNNFHPIHFDRFLEALPVSMGLSVFPALTEEAVFRYGIVNGAAALAGPWVALVAGSLPFGLAHLAGNYFGGNLQLLETVGLVLAGLLLSLVYLKWGLPAAILCHATWNALSIPFLKGMFLDPKTDMARFEGAWTTCVLLLIMCLYMLGTLSSEWTAQKKK